MKKNLIIAIISTILIFTFTISVYGETNNNPLINAYNIGKISSPDENVKELQTIDGNKIKITNYDAIIQSYLDFGYAKTKSQAENLLIEKELFLLEATKNNITVTEDEFNTFIEEQKDNLNELRSKGDDTFDSYLEGWGHTEEEYWRLFENEYRKVLLETKYTNYLYKNFIKDKIEMKLIEMNLQVTQTTFDSLVKNEISYYNDEVIEEFLYYLDQYKKDLRIKEEVNLTF